MHLLKQREAEEAPGSAAHTSTQNSIAALKAQHKQQEVVLQGTLQTFLEQANTFSSTTSTTTTTTSSSSEASATEQSLAQLRQRKKAGQASYNAEMQGLKNQLKAAPPGSKVGPRHP